MQAHVHTDIHTCKSYVNYDEARWDRNWVHRVQMRGRHWRPPTIQGCGHLSSCGQTKQPLPLPNRLYSTHCIYTILESNNHRSSCLLCIYGANLLSERGKIGSYVTRNKLKRHLLGLNHVNRKCCFLAIPKIVNLFQVQEPQIWLKRRC